MNITPFLRTPFTDAYSTFNNYQSHRFCGPYELRVVDCLEAYGLPKGYDSCRLLMDDFRECVVKNKQTARMNIMRDERDRQWAAGERKQHYAEDPICDTF